LNPAHAASIARDKWFAQQVLREAGIATIPSRLFFVTATQAAERGPGRELKDARGFAASAAYPLFCKPVSGSQGAFAERVDDAAEFARYIERVAKHHYAMLVQPVIEAREHRVVVLKGAPLFCYEKHSAQPGLPANRSAGGSASEPTTDVPQALRTIAVEATQTLGLDFAAIDMFETERGPVVIEVNAAPAVQTLEDYGRWDLIETIWTANIEAAFAR